MTLSKEFLTSLGLITTNFQALEKYIEFFIWVLIPDDQEVGQIITSQRMSFHSLCDLLVSLFIHKCDVESLREELRDLISRAESSAQARDTAIHSAWLTSDSDDEIVTRFKITARRKKGLSRQIVELKLDDLRQTYKEISSVAKDLISFMEKIRGLGIINYRVVEKSG